MLIYKIHQIVYSINQITLGDMNMENIVGQHLQPARRQQGQLIWKGARSSGYYKKIKINNYYCGLALLQTRLEQSKLINVWKSISSPKKE